MVDSDKQYPNLTWAQFDVCNDDATGAFEDMSRRLFSLEFLEKGTILHSDHNNPGVEVLPILEPVHLDGSKQRKISFQAKYFEGPVSFKKIKDSMNQAVKHYENELDLIYLFCNKTITTTNKGYIETVKLLKKAGIELYPISNKEVLDLAAKHKEIANYFFLPRKRPVDTRIGQMHTGIVINCDNIEYGSCPIRVREQAVDPRLLQGFAQEKIQMCRALILETRFDKLREEIGKIFTYRLTRIPGAERLVFYKSILELHDDKEIEASLDDFAEQDKIEMSWIEGYCKNPVSIGTYTFAQHCVEIQVIILDKMFSAELWNEVIVLCKEIIDDASSEIIDVVKQYYGLSLFNLQKYDLASDILRELYQKSHKENILLYSILAEIKNINNTWQENHYENRERLIELIKQLDALKDNKQYKINISLIAMIYLETAYNLGINEKKHLENAIERYQGFPENVKNEEAVKYLYALCLEINGSIEVAEGIYAELNWRHDTNIACRYLICILSRNDYTKAVKVYKDIMPSALNAKLKCLYLKALYYEDNDGYQRQLKETLSEVQDNLEGTIDIAFEVHEKKHLKDDIIPLIKKHLDTEINELPLIYKTKLLSVLSHAGEVKIILAVLRSIPDIENLNRYIIREIYEATFAISNQEFIGHDRSMIKSERLEASEFIADIFLKTNILRREFLQIKYLCAGAKEKKFSMLKYAKELFEITNEECLARNIIALLFERNETDFSVYAPYVAVLSNSINPDSCMAVAVAMLRLGKIEEADLYAYKALFYLNGTDDYEIYKKYLGYYNQNLSRYHDEGEYRRVKNNCVVTLEENISEDIKKTKIITICLDSESEFSDINNISMGIQHIINGSPLYLKLQGSCLNQILKIEGINYRLTNIQSRTDFAASFVFRKINENPEKFDGAIFVLSTENPEDLIEKLKSMTNSTKQIATLLKYYHFKENEIGLPVDSFVHGEYERYIDALTMLLHTKNQAFYTGLPTYEDEENQRYIPALSTLVMLSSMNMLNTLERIKGDLVLPASYVDFFAERYRKAKETSRVSPGTLVNVNNQLTLIQNSQFHIEIWERIIDFCSGCEKVHISDDDRIEFSIGDINGEQFIAVAHLHLIQLDSLILAKKEQATLLCDDLFFRRIATSGKIRNINFASLLLRYKDEDFVIPIIMELSKTNYLYIPLMARTDEEANQLRKNILDGEIKKKYYGDMLIAYSAAWKNAIHELLGEDIDVDEVGKNSIS